MTLDEFKAELEKDSQEFFNQWKANQAKDPQFWPNSMSEGDWFEQFLAFQTGGLS